MFDYLFITLPLALSTCSKVTSAININKYYISLSVHVPDLATERFLAMIRAYTCQ
jgi:hypothetical protein